MDVSTFPESSGISCDHCGYSRRGLAAEALCPECGESPPVMGVGAHLSGRTREELTWLRFVAVGLWVLVIASIGALQVALITPADELSIGTMNFPGPKVHAAAMVQRSIGGQPGPWGVAGTCWALASALGVWLITERRALRADSEHLFSLRSLTRWVTVISTGGVAGMLLSGADPYISPRGGLTLNLYSLAVGLCELPATTLLYLYLNTLAQRLDDRRSAGLFSACRWAVPAVIGAAVLLLMGGSSFHTDAPLAWRLAGIAYGAVAVGAGAAAMSAVLRLAIVTSAASFNGSFAGAATSMATLIRRAIYTVDANLHRWCVVVGIALLVLSVPVNIGSVLTMRSRKGFAGDVPAFNFAGPKLCAAADIASLSSNRNRLYEQWGYSMYIHIWPAISSMVGPLLCLLAIWLITMPGISVAESRRLIITERLRRLTRYLAVASVGVPFGYVLSLALADELSFSRAMAFICVFGEAPATLCLYLYLSRLATGKRAGTLRKMACVAPLLIVLPLVALVVSVRLQHWRMSPLVGLAGGIYIAISLAASIIACGAMARLAWELARPVPRPQYEPVST